MAQTVTAATNGNFHPLDPLGADEFRAVTAVLARKHGVGQVTRPTCPDVRFG